MANATEAKEIVTKNSKEVKVEKNDSFKEVKTEKLTSIDNMFFGCASEGNEIYEIGIAEGSTHREARATRRAYVRKCRNYFWQFGIF